MSAQALTVAIASENDDFDGELYRALLELVLERPVLCWKTEMRFDGHRAVYKLAEPFLSRARQHGVQHALFAVDNDGGSRRRPEHSDECPAPGTPPAAIGLDDDDACRVCWLQSGIPASWSAAGGLLCLAVPVQTIETWLLHLRGDELTPSAEQVYNRPTLKKRFFGKPLPASKQRIQLALEQLQRADALLRLRERASFRLLESQLAAWR